MQQREEIGYFSQSEQDNAHAQTKFLVATSTFLAHEFIYGLVSPIYNPLFLLAALKQIVILLNHQKNNFGASQLVELKRAAGAHAVLGQLNGQPLRLSEMKMCLFSSAAQVQEKHSHTIENSFMFSTACLKLITLLMEEGATSSNISTLVLATIFIFGLILGLYNAHEKDYDAEVVSADRVLMM